MKGVITSVRMDHFQPVKVEFLTNIRNTDLNTFFKELVLMVLMQMLMVQSLSLVRMVPSQIGHFASVKMEQISGPHGVEPRRS